MTRILFFTPACLGLELFDFLRRRRFGQLVVEFFAGLTAKGLQIRALRPGHWFFTGAPLCWIFFRIFHRRGWFFGSHQERNRSGEHYRSYPARPGDEIRSGGGLAP